MMKARPRAVTIKDIAAELSLSHTTVSRALNDHAATSAETKAQVRAAAERLGYVRNLGVEMMRGAPSRLIGLIVPDVQNDFYAAVAKILATRCAEANLQLVLAVSEDDGELELKHVTALCEARVAGIAITAARNMHERTRALLETVPTVQLIRTIPDLPGALIGLAEQEGVGLATRHLIDLGHRRIAFIGGSRELSTGRERLAGFEAALADAKLKAAPELVQLGAPRPAFGEEALNRLWTLRERPTAIVMSSSQLTLGALTAIHRMGVRVPEQVSLVGYGDPDWFKLWGPGVTTIGLPVEELTSAAAAMLFQSLSDQEAEDGEVERFRPHLIVRGTTMMVKD